MAIRLRYLVAILVAILLSPFGAFWAWSSIESARLDRMLDALETRREPLDPAEFDRKPTTADERQASHLYKQAAGAMADLRPRWLTEAGKLIEEYCGASDPVTRQGRAASLESLENRYKPALELLDRAAALDADGWDDRDRPPSDSIESNFPYELAGVNAVRVARLACDGNGDAAGAALLASLRLQRVIPRWATRPYQTTHSLQLVLAAGASVALLETLQREYERMADDGRLEFAVQRARAHWLSYAVPGAFSESPSMFDSRRMTPVEAVSARLLRPARDHMVTSELHEFDDVIGALKAPWPQKLHAARAIASRYPRASRGFLSAMTRPLDPHVASSIVRLYANSMAESLARTRASIGALGIERWRVAHGGALPPALHDLTTEYVAVKLADPYSGSELVYSRIAGGYKIYSVGINDRDDGGTWDSRSDLQMARRGDPLDVGIVVREFPK
jgi:hypothetical protein